MSKIDEIKLKVAEAHQDDVDRGIVRIDSQALKELNVNPGDFVEIEGHDKKTVAICARAYPRDVGINIIRMDGLARHNAGTSLGELVKLHISNPKEAKRVIIAPIQQGVKIMGPSDSLNRALIGRPLSKGDVTTLRGGYKRRSQMTMRNPIEEVFRMLNDDMQGMGMGLGALANIKFVVVSTMPKETVIVTENTKLIVKSEAVEIDEDSIPGITYEDIGGIRKEITKVREMVEIPLKHPELFARLGISAPTGVLLYGPPGTGKTLLAKAVANESEAHFININGPEVMSKWVGEAEKKLRNVFKDAAENAPSIIFIDEIDSIAPKRSEATGEVERRVVAQLLASMDGLESRGKVIVIAATNRENAIDPALRRPGRFDREIEIGVPDRIGRLEIFKIHTRSMPLANDVDIKQLSKITHGFVGADIEAVCKEAAMLALRRYLPEIKQAESDGDEEISNEILMKIQVTDTDFKGALKVVQPSAMREVMIEIPNIKWDDVGGLEEIKSDLKESVEWPLKYPNSFKKIGIKPPKGILLYGPPGCGKTLLAKAVANESEANFISVKGPELISKWVGESEKAIREIFRKARQVAPSIIFFDEIDAIASRRGMETGPKVAERVVNQILTEMDGLEELSEVIVIAATNRPDMIDEGLLRPGRFDKLILVTPPDIVARKKIFEVHTKKMPLKNMTFNKFAEKTEGYSGADVEAIVREAGMTALRKNKKAVAVTKEHFENAFKQVRPSISKNSLEFYKDFEKRFKQSYTAEDVKSYFG
ncbi:MAG: CDC48 family AAA ATPase [Nanoarchaeota archaeon]|nr:CDC48 family AAA ATPase [Nanoarchaeota archaeon]